MDLTDHGNNKSYSCASCYKGHVPCGAQILAHENLTVEMTCFLYAEVGNDNLTQSLFEADDWTEYETSFRSKYPNFSVINGEKRKRRRDD